MIKTSLICLIIAVTHFALTAQEVITPAAKTDHLSVVEAPDFTPAGISVELGTTRFHMLSREGTFLSPWLLVIRPDDSTRGYVPASTRLISDFRPVVKETKDGKYEITFAKR